MRSDLGDLARLKHAVEAMEEIETYTSGIDFEQFDSNSMMRYACVKQLEIIGEACRHLSQELKARYSEIPWVHIVGMRNVFVHEYFGIDSMLVWEIVKSDLPEFKEQLLFILAHIESSSE